jgi:hypothetical protein
VPFGDTPAPSAPVTWAGPWLAAWFGTGWGSGRYTGGMDPYLSPLPSLDLVPGTSGVRERASAQPPSQPPFRQAGFTETPEAGEGFGVPAGLTMADAIRIAEAMSACHALRNARAAHQQADRILGAEFEDAQVDVMLFADALRNVLRGAERVLGRRHQAVQAFKTEVPDAEHVRNIYEHFDAYVEGKGHRQQDKSIGPEDWKPLHSKVGDDFYVVGFGPYRLEVGPAREASARLLAATLNAADAG